MSIFTTKGKSVSFDTLDTLYESLNYITRATAAQARYIYGASVSTVNAYAEMKAVKRAYGQMNGKGFFHYILIPELFELIPVDSFFSLGIGITEYISHFHGHFQSLMAIHFDKAPYLHLHIVANNIDLDTGARMDLDRRKLASLKQGISQILIASGVSPIRQNSVVDEMGVWKNQEF